MDEDPKSKSWWNTLPGVLTAVAAVVAAVTALVSTLHQTGWIDAKAPTSLSAANGAAVSSTSKPPPGPTTAAPATPGSIALPAQTTLTYGKLSYQILSARVAHPTPDTLSLQFSIRMTSDDQYEANFWDASFRLRVNGVLQAPVSNLNKVVAGNSSTDGVVEFVVPSGTAQVELQMGEVGNGKPGVAMVLPAG